ncbi:helix-turn-helix domain-containing protein [Erwiniaceae bacterium L1_54_6]|jgi:AraC family transcriptional regulator, mar-sox-rob regulon activator|uniref:AraC family transcriptional regulator n=2 Tax=Pantoea TaxID=53335 RepID=A0AAP9H247_9GAMM|nr:MULTISPECIES: helix-turn-helix domain-containing protein [Pantoea]MDF7659884.1 helix-turn-helix domain-containing protein [Erwiniaceae bacterium L1_54_6]ADU67685.1 transcriptional regulator, AraC family [Pantoea sp. At-9b]ERK15102.1 multiple resistance protein [Pantoea sp. AS-PWVM4]MBP2196148.1 AraC family mar-sox-rob regulon transcriptional activator [Pantoea cypripedii]MDE1189928.1 helix-turn-helix domain-containing protein [Pantoea sp.]
MNQSQFIRSLLDWIEDNLGHDLHLDEVARRSGYSRWHLQRLFRQHTGFSLAEYIRQRRLTESALTLLNSDEAILQVAMSYGFDTQQAYTRTFKNYFRVTPGQLRRQRRVEPDRLLFPLAVAS